MNQVTIDLRAQSASFPGEAAAGAGTANSSAGSLEASLFHATLADQLRPPLPPAKVASPPVDSDIDPATEALQTKIGKMLEAGVSRADVVAGLAGKLASSVAGALALPGTDAGGKLQTVFATALAPPGARDAGGSIADRARAIAQRYIRLAAVASSVLNQVGQQKEIAGTVSDAQKAKDLPARTKISDTSAAGRKPLSGANNSVPPNGAASPAAAAAAPAAGAAVSPDPAVIAAPPVSDVSAAAAGAVVAPAVALRQTHLLHPRTAPAAVESSAGAHAAVTGNVAPAADVGLFQVTAMVPGAAASVPSAGNPSAATAPRTLDDAASSSGVSGELPKLAARAARSGATGAQFSASVPRDVAAGAHLSAPVPGDVAAGLDSAPSSVASVAPHLAAPSPSDIARSRADAAQTSAANGTATATAPTGASAVAAMASQAEVPLIAASNVGGGDGRRVNLGSKAAVTNGGDTPLGRTLTRAALAADARQTLVGPEPASSDDSTPSPAAAAPVAASPAGPAETSLAAFVRTFEAALQKDAPADGRLPAQSDQPPAAAQPAHATADAAPFAPAVPPFAIDRAAVAAAPETPALRPPVDHTAIADQVLRGAFMRNVGQSSEIRLTLDPQILGDVSVKLVVNAGNVTAHMVAESSDVRDALVAAQPQLTKSLADAGLKLTGFSVDVSGSGFAGFSQQQNDRSQNGSRRGAPLGDTADDEAALEAIPSFGPSVGAAKTGDFNYLA